MKMRFFVIAATLAALSVSAFAKTGSTIYTSQRVANARANILAYSWASSLKTGAVGNADTYANQGWDWLWNFITPQSIPRGIHVCTAMGCPNCGHAIDAYGNYPWVTDPINHPWKIKCPNCQNWYPKNDFRAFYNSGLDSNGTFVYANADRALLYNTDHPDPADPLHMYCVDDSLGWKDGSGNTYRFIGYYDHYAVWNRIQWVINCFRDAYIYTGDRKYSDAAAIWLYRIAQFYPSMDWNYWYKQGFDNSDGGSGKGKIMGRIWEPGLVDSFNGAYDGIYPGLDNDTALLNFLSAKTGSTVTTDSMRSLIETNIIRQVHDAILNFQIVGNEGMYQNTMTTAAIVLDSQPTTTQWLDWVFHSGNMPGGNNSGGNINGLLNSIVDDDGMGSEVSPMYNAIWRGMFNSLSNILEVYPSYTNNSLVLNPKYQKMFEAPARIICSRKFVPNIGDGYFTGQPALDIAAGDLVYAYDRFGADEYAQLAYAVNGNSTSGLHLGILDPDPEGVKTRITNVINAKGPYLYKTDNLPSYGLAILRSGSGVNERDVSLYYGDNYGSATHGHRDTLNFELFAKGLSLMPDLGYPEYADMTNPSRMEWTSNTISHNTVVVDQRKQARISLGDCHFVSQGDGVAVAEVSAEACYSQTSLYQRTLALVDTSSTDSYVADIFRVKGGSNHEYSLHGPQGEYTTNGLNMAVQATGTLAGSTVLPYADLGYGPSFNNATGFQYLYDLRKDTAPSSTPSVTWNVVDTWKVNSPPQSISLRATLLSPPGTVTLVHGDPPRNKVGNPPALWYLLSYHTSSPSTFASIIEPYSGAPLVSGVQRSQTGDTVTLTVTTASGRVDTIVSCLTPTDMVVAGMGFYGKFCVVSQQGGVTTMKLMVPTVDSIGLGFQQPDNREVSLSGKMVTAAKPGAFWIQEATGLGALKVLSNVSVSVGDRVNVAGYLTRSGSQRALLASIVNDLGPGSLIKPVFMAVRNLGGSDLNSLTPGVTTTKGLYNIGMLVKVAGKVTYADTSDPNAKFFYLDDGSGFTDTSGHSGVKVLCDDNDPPTSGSVSVTGIVSSEEVGTDVVPRILIRDAGDIGAL